jgi:hypothetical protein
LFVSLREKEKEKRDRESSEGFDKKRLKKKHLTFSDHAILDKNSYTKTKHWHGSAVCHISELKFR